MTGSDAFDLLPEAVVVVDRDRTVLAVNDRAGSLLGLGAGAVGGALGDVLELRTDEGVRCADPVPGTTTAHRIAERTWSVHLPDGRDRRVTMAGRWVDGDRVVLTFRPADRLASREARRADVVASVSHELRAPLATIRGFTRSMLRDWDRFSDEQRRTFLAAIEDDAERVGRLLDDLLTVSRLDSHRTPLQRERVDVPALCEAVVAKAGARPVGEGRDLRVVVDDDGPLLVDGDRHRLEQVLTNLVENALVHAAEASVQLRPSRAEDDRVVVDVVDDGPGVPPSVRARVFEKFGRGRDAAGSGTGLGLYIARGLARAHGGDLTLVDDGDGATFRVVLPAAPTT